MFSYLDQVVVDRSSYQLRAVELRLGGDSRELFQLGPCELNVGLVSLVHFGLFPLCH